MRIARAIVVAALAGGLMSATAPVATAESGTLNTGYGHITYRDSDDLVTVCDDAVDGDGVTGRISIKQADGSWGHFPWIRDPSPAEGCESRDYDVIRENAGVYLALCRQNGPDGPRFDCDWRWLQG